jgi:hypothetical protein
VGVIGKQFSIALFIVVTGVLPVAEQRDPGGKLLAYGGSFYVLCKS